jgi:ACS family tartrate transporter-like MFS transporter
VADDGDRVSYKVKRRLIPLLMLCYFVSFIDRVNVGFASLSMNRDLGLGPAIYGWGAGIFFLGYFLFEVPSNVLLERFGARLWIARIMISWGFISMGMAAVRGPSSFMVLRFLLGVAEAGFYPGVVLYLTYWFPAEERAKVMGWFTLANPISTVVGGPISGAILDAAGSFHGLRTWQWLFLIEGAPAVLMGIIVGIFLTDRPAQAPWLTLAEREQVEQWVAEDRAKRAVQRKLTLWEGLTDPRILLLGAIYFGCIAGNYGLSFWLPQIVKAFGLTNFQTGLVTALPYACGAIGMLLWSAHSDKTRERIWHVALPLLLAGVSLFASSRLGHPVVTMIFMCLAGIGIFANTPPFWTLPTSLMTGTAAAGGVALVNSLGNLSGFAVPYMIGWIRASGGSFGSALMALAAFPLASMALTLWLGRSKMIGMGEPASRRSTSEPETPANAKRN